jgi:hypothetical protein
MWESINDYISNAPGIVPMMFKIMEEINATNLGPLAMLVWNIWWRRNQKCWHEKLPTVHEIIRRAKDTLCDWNLAQQQKKNNSSTVTEIYAWTKPPMGALKCNVDTTCYLELHIYGIGACVRDAQGKFVRAYTGKFKENRR